MTTSLRSAPPALYAVLTPAARFSTSACARDATAEAEPSSRSRSQFTARPGESKTEAWARNMSEARDWRRRQAAINSQVNLYLPPGIDNPTHPDPSSRVSPRDPASSSHPSPREASIATLLAAGAALGHKKNIMHPAYLPFVYGNRAGLSVIDLDQTLSVLRRCATVVRDIVKDDGVVLFVSKQRNATLQIKARMGDNGFVAARWMPGLLTNSET